MGRMSKIKSKNTGPELAIRKELDKLMVKHQIHYNYMTNYKKLPGKPDIVFVGALVVVFIHGCFWHRCPICNLPLPKTRIKWWKRKLERNRIRDLGVERLLSEMGWKVLIFWEHEIKKDPKACAKLVMLSL